MSNLTIHFDNPWLLFVIIPLLLITLIPFIRIPKKFRNTRNRVISVTLHCLVAIMLSCLLAGLYFTFTVPNKDNEVMIVVDSSDSNKESTEARDTYIQQIIGMCGENYKVGIVTFGYDNVYAAPLSFDTKEVYRQYLISKATQSADGSATDISSALEFAAAQFENPANAKIVLLSDGFETDNSAVNTAKLLASDGIKIDTVNFPDEEYGEIQLIDAELPKGKLLDNVEVTLYLTVESSLTEDVNVSVTLYDNNVGETSSYTLSPGTQELEIPHTFISSGEHDLIFTLNCPTNTDHVTENNIYQLYANIYVPEKALVLESIAGESTSILGMLPATMSADIVNVKNPGNGLPRTAKELCAYDEVILCNISNADLTSDVMPDNFVSMLYSYVYDMGGSMFTYGGQNDVSSADGSPVPHAYNRDDLNGTLFQQMLPVEAVDYTPPSAVMIVIDTSGSMSMGKADAAYDGAEEVINALYDSNPYSYCGVISFSVATQDQVRVLPISQRDTLLDTIDQLRNGGGSGGGNESGGTIFSNSIRYGGLALNAIDVPIKHMILLTDGDPSDDLGNPEDQTAPGYGRFIKYNKDNGITLSIITFGVSDDNAKDMKEAAETWGGGKYYSFSTSSDDLMQVGTAMRNDLATINVAAFEDGLNFRPEMNGNSAIFNNLTHEPGVSPVLPILNGYYGTKPRTEADTPITYQYVPIYAEWTFGAGKVGSFMCDIGGSWSTEFLSDRTGNGVTVISNIINNLAPSVKPEDDALEFTVSSKTQNYTNRIDVYTDLNEGESVRVSISYISQNNSADVNGDFAAAMQQYGMSGVPVTPLGNGMSFDFNIIYTGVYRILIEKLDAAGNVIADISSYRTFSYSSEYDGIRDMTAGEKLLADIAAGGNGVVQSDPIDTITSFDPTIDMSYDPALVMLILSIVMILLDIAVRKFKFKWIHEIIRDRKLNKDDKLPGSKQGERY